MGPLQQAGLTLLLCAGLAVEDAAPVYLPVSYRILNAEAAFFLQEANQDVMGNASLQARAQPFFIQQAAQTPVLAVSYGPWSLRQPLPPELLGGGAGPVSTATPTKPPLLTSSWKVQASIIRQQVHPSWPRVQVLFHVLGRRWDQDGGGAQLPCVAAVAFHETQEVRGGCRLEGPLGLCVAQLQPLAAWFGPPSVRPGRRRVPESGQGTPVELYYLLQPPDGGGGDCSSAASTQAWLPGGVAGPAPMQRIGTIRLLQPLVELKLDQNFVVMVPSEAAGQGETLTAFLAAAAATGTSVQTFSLRVKMKAGVAFLGARASDPAAWTVSQDIRSEGHRVVTLHCQRKTSFVQRTAAAAHQQLLQVDLEMNVLVGPEWTQEVTWQLEYPLTQTVTPEVTTHIHLAQQHLGGIVPLAMEVEILNTAVLTGRSVAVPVKVVAVASDGAVADVTESAECETTDEHVIKVSERCDYVYVNGSETRGRSRALLNFTYSYLSAQLQVSVWAPRLPLLIQLSDPELNQIKGWRVPLSSAPHSWSPQQGGCVEQYQSSALRVLTYFVADEDGMSEEEEPEQHHFLLGSDWQVEVTQMVEDWLRVADPHLAQVDGAVLMGLKAGTTSVQVLSPLTSAVLAETPIRVLDDRVSVTQLGVTLVSGLSLSLQLSPGSSRAIVATTTTQEVIESLEQESLISAWLQFSDGSMTPLDQYPPDRFTLTATSLEEQVVQVQSSGTWKWPTVVAKGEGQGRLVRVELRPSGACRPETLGGVLAAGTASVRVRLAEPEQRSRRTGSGSEPDAGPPERSASTNRDQNRPGTRLGTDGEVSDFSEYPSMAEDQLASPRGRTEEDQLVSPRGRTEEDQLASLPGRTSLGVAVFALLGVFCLAVLGFLVNGVSYAYKYHSKQSSLENPGMVSHDWVWLGQEEGLRLPGLLEEAQLGAATRANNGSSGRNDALNSPTTQRKRVKFTTFSNARSSSGCPGLGPLALVHTTDVKWVGPDMELGDPKDPRRYLDKLHKELNQ